MPPSGHIENSEHLTESLSMPSPLPILLLTSAPAPAPLCPRQADRICHQWADSGFCRRGDSCRFEHPPRDELPASPAGRAAGRSRGRGGRRSPVQEEEGGFGAAEASYPGGDSYYQAEENGGEDSYGGGYSGSGGGYSGGGGGYSGGGGGGGRSNLCYQWAERGYCGRGDSCRFEHPPREELPGSTSGGGGGRRAAGGGGRSGVCFQWAERGYCRHGDRCRFEHPPQEEQVCVASRRLLPRFPPSPT